MYRKPDIVSAIEVRRLERASRVVRIFDVRTVKKVFVGKCDGRGKAGGPKLRRLDCIEYGLEWMVVKRQRKETVNIAA